MTVEDAKKITHTLNEIVTVSGRMVGQDETALRSTARTLQHHVSELRQTLDLTAMVERDRTTAQLLNKLLQVSPEGSRAAVLLKLARAELRKHGMTLRAS